MAVMSVRLTEVSIGSEGVLGTDRMTVNPLSLGGVAAEPEHLKDLPAVDMGVSVLSQGSAEPADPSGARNGIQAEGPNACAVVAVDRVAHRSVAVGSIVAGQGSALDPEDQISDGVGVGIGATPAHRFTCRGAHPDHTFLAPCLSDPESVVHVGRPVATVRVKLAPCLGLDCDGVCHVLSVCR